MIEMILNLLWVLIERSFCQKLLPNIDDKMTEEDLIGSFNGIVDCSLIKKPKNKTFTHITLFSRTYAEMAIL